MKVAYLECFAGIAGDMLMGALVDAGVDPAVLQRAASSLQVGVTLDFKKVDRSGIQSTKARVLVDGKDADGGLPEETAGLHPAAHTHSHAHTHGGETHSHTHTHATSDDNTHNHEHHTHEHTLPAHEHSHSHVHGRTLEEIRHLIQHADLAEQARATALKAFEILGEAEAKIHGVPIATIHFHEVGAVDAIVDIVCGAVGAHALGVERWYASPVNTGSGFVDCAHGRFPVPTPATIEILQGVPVYAAGPPKEMTTPTGAALLRALGCRFEGTPAMRGSAIGYGAGTRNPEGFPNVLRLRIGDTELASQEGRADSDTVIVLECAIDDATPEVLAHAAQQLLEHGALDVMQQPVTMKKGRQGILLTVLCATESAREFEELLFRETTTLGVRRREEHRSILKRSSSTVDTTFGPIRVKYGLRDGDVINFAPEFEDCRAAALRHAVPLKQVMQAAISAASQPAMEPTR